ncbi:MAG TPA: D-2-hydroxyacid dehydrogenase family protein [Acidobacteriota bacterium]|nr:D-2-hydroxyacid dehydrogenase family protein [Acidobacteriota bacterium]
MNIVILDDYQDAVRSLQCFTKLKDHQVTIYQDTTRDLDTLVERLKDAEAVVLIRERTPITQSLLQRLPNLKLISQTGKISNHLDLQACTACGIAVTEGMGSPVAPAELCWALIMAASRRLPDYCNALHHGRWQQTQTPGLGRVLKSLTLGIWSYGKVGRVVASYGRAFGMEVMIWGRESSLAAAQSDGFRVAGSQNELFSKSDVLSIHLRLNAATRGCIKYSDLARMKPDALFVNTSRAELIENGALERALNEDRPGSAALDVYESEPILDANHPLLKMKNVLCSPHLGYVEKSSYELYFKAAFENILTFAAGKPQNIANPQVFK